MKTSRQFDLIVFDWDGTLFDSALPGYLMLRHARTTV